MNAEALYKVSRDDFGGNPSDENAANHRPRGRAPQASACGCSWAW